MTELEKMQNNMPYLAMDPEIVALQRQAAELVNRFNLCMEEEERMEILQKLFGECNGTISVAPGFRCDFGFNIYAKGFLFVNYNCVFLDTSKITLGANTFIGPGTCLSCASHPIQAKERNQGYVCSQPITIGENVWIGANCTVRGGVTIGENTVIGGGSVVLKDVPANVVAAGNPCRVIREISNP